MTVSAKIKFTENIKEWSYKNTFKLEEQNLINKIYL